MRPEPRGFAAIALSLLGVLLVGCETARSARDSVATWVDSPSRPARASFAGVADAKLYSDPDASSPVVAELALHEPVLAYQVEHDFTLVRAEDGRRSGWVRSRDLVDRLPPPPRARPSAKPAQQRIPEVDAAEAEPAQQPPPESEPAEPQSESEPPVEAPERSVFDPY